MPTSVEIPLYDPVILGNPAYIWIILALGGALVIGIVYFKTEVYDMLQPVWGFRDSAASGKPQMIVQGMNGKMWLESVDHVANIFRSMALPLMWIITVPISGQMGKVNTAIVSDDWNVVHNLDIDYAIVDIVHKWHEKQEELPEEERQYVHDWASFQKHLMNGDFAEMVPDGVVLPPFRVVNLNEIKTYLPKWDAAHHAGYINREVEARMKNPEEKGAELLKYAITAAGIMLIGAIGAYLIISNAH
jgi:hypothetical protein